MLYQMLYVPQSKKLYFKVYQLDDDLLTDKLTSKEIKMSVITNQPKKLIV